MMCHVFDCLALLSGVGALDEKHSTLCGLGFWCCFVIRLRVAKPIAWQWRAAVRSLHGALRTAGALACHALPPCTARQWHALTVRQHCQAARRAQSTNTAAAPRTREIRHTGLAALPPLQPPQLLVWPTRPRLFPSLGPQLAPERPPRCVRRASNWFRFGFPSN